MRDSLNAIENGLQQGGALRPTTGRPELSR